MYEGAADVVFAQMFSLSLSFMMKRSLCVQHNKEGALNSVHFKAEGVPLRDQQQRTQRGRVGLV